jgi:RNA methyltransferase, TrmH family
MPSLSEIKFVRSLHQKKFRQAEKAFIAEGPKVVEELLLSRYSVSKIFALKDYAEENALAENFPAKTKIVSPAELKKISALTTPNRVLAVAEIPEHAINISTVNNSLSIALDDVSDPGNLGTIIRIAHWFGISTIICSENCVDAYNPKVVQAAMGSLFFVDVVQTNLEGFFSDKKLTAPVYGTVLDGKSIYAEKPKHPAILLFGNESAGISNELKKFITHPVTIPPAGSGHKPDSLNVATASAILCAEFFR